jgi:hypothetical protein
VSLSITRLNSAPRTGLPLDDDRTMECWMRQRIATDDSRDERPSAMQLRGL